MTCLPKFIAVTISEKSKTFLKTRDILTVISGRFRGKKNSNFDWLCLDTTGGLTAPPDHPATVFSILLHLVGSVFGYCLTNAIPVLDFAY